MTNTVKDTDKGARRILRNMRGLEGTTILVGVQGKEAAEAHKTAPGEAAPKAPMTVGVLASIHELGLGNVPERSWLRAWVDENQAMIESDLRRATRQVLLGKLTREQAAGVLGTKWVASIQERITRHIPPPLDPQTIARKESSTPLIDTGQLKSAITFLVEGALSKGGPLVSA